MMRFSLADFTRRARNPRRSTIDLRPIIPTASLAADLYARAYKPIVTHWLGSLDRVAAAYQRALPVRDGFTDSIFDLDSILATIDAELQRLVLSITPALRSWSLRMEGWQRGKWRGAVLTATSIDLGTILSPSDVNDTLDGFLSRNVALVRSVSDDTRARIADVVMRGYQARVPIVDVAREMRDAVGIGRARAIRVAADQSSKLSARLDQARQEQAGITSFRWRHSHKKHPRAVHVAHDGKVYPWSTPPLLDGKPDRPGQAPYCGCRAQAVVDLG